MISRKVSTRDPASRPEAGSRVLQIERLLPTLTRTRRTGTGRTRTGRTGTGRTRAGRTRAGRTRTGRTRTASAFRGGRNASAFRDDFPAEHHGVVFVRQIVAVSDILACEGSEPAVECHCLGWSESHHILFRVVVGGHAACPALDTVLFHVEVDRVDPPAAPVPDGPEFTGSLFREGHTYGRVKGLAIDQPLDLPTGGAALEFKRTLRHVAGLDIGQWDVRERAEGCRHLAVIHGVATDDELEHRQLIVRIRRLGHAPGAHLRS